MVRIAIAVLGATILVAGIAVWLLQRTAPEEPSQTWVKGRGAGQTLRLYASGRFELSNWCDVCAPNQQLGTWSSTDSTITLHETPGQSIDLARISFRGCAALASETHPRFPTDVYFLADDHCGDAL